MYRGSLCLHTGLVLILLVCIADGLYLTDRQHSRQKRGFRMNTASRVAHGYGKRGYSSTFDLSPSSSDKKELPDFSTGEDDNRSILSTRDFSRLLQLNHHLADVVVRKFIDINDDDLVSTDELFRRIRE